MEERIPAVGAGASLTQVLTDEGARSTGGYAVATATFVPDTSQIAQGATNFATLQLRQVRGGAVLGVVGTLSLGANACVAETPLAFSLAAPASPWAAEDLIDVNVLTSGLGGTVPAGLVRVEAA